MPDTRVLVIANNLLARTGLAALLNTQETLYIVGQIAGEPETLAGDLAVYRPDVAVIDLGYEPLSLLPRLNTLIEAQTPPVVLLPDSSTLSAVLTLLMEGSTYSLLLREAEPQLLAQAIIATANGLVTFDPLLAAELLPETVITAPVNPVESLTPRESEVLHLLAQGMANKAIAQALSISPNTVKFHVNAILTKLDARSRTEAVVRATQLGLIAL
ncbi:MAG: response regulator transcription factor [Anaerolineae bacterium]